MKKIFAIAIAVVALGFMGQASALPTDNVSISVTVTFATTLDVAIAPGVWAIAGTVDIDDVKGPEPFTLTNNSKVTVKAYILGTDGAGGWLMKDSVGLNNFTVDVTPTTPAGAAVKASTTVVRLFATIAGKGATQDLSLTYTAPNDSDTTDGTAEDFSVKFKIAKTSAAAPGVW